MNLGLSHGLDAAAKAPLYRGRRLIDLAAAQRPEIRPRLL
jgi:hypothetical protein